METSNGRLNFQAVIDIEQLKRDMARMKAEFEGMTKKAKKEGSETQRIINNMLKGATAYLTIQQARNFANQVVQIRGQFQQLNVAFETMLGNKAKADELMAQVVDFAAKTPFQLTDVASGTKQLLAYRIEQEKILPTLKALGDISAGLSVPIGRLILNYGQVKTATRLTGRELRDFNMAGVPLVAELSKNLNKSETAIQEMVSAGKIGFKEVEEAFRTMTSEGGRFADLMDKQSGTITGKISNLQDAIDEMFNDIGKANEGIINSAIDGAGYLVENYEKVGKILGELIATYGVYRTALIATTAVQGVAIEVTKGYTVAETFRYRALLLSEKAQKAFNASVLANPYVVIIGAIVGAGYAIYKYKTHLTETEKAQKRVTSAVAEFNAEVSTEKRQLDRLFIKLKNVEKGTKEWNNIRDTIVRNYGQYNDNLKTELETINGQKKAYDSLNLSIQDTIRLKFKENLTKELSENYQKVEQETRDKVYEFLKDELGNKTDKNGHYLVETIMQDLQVAFRTGHTGVIDNLKVFTDENFEGWFKGSGVKAKNKLKSLFNDLVEQAKALSVGNRKIDIKFGTKKKNEDDIKKESEKTQTLRSRADVLKEIHDKKVLINNLQKKSKKGISEKEKENLKTYKEELSNLNKELELLTGKKISTSKTEKLTFDQERYEQQNKRKLQDLEHQKQQGIIDAMQEGAEKQYKQLEEDAKRKLQLLERAKEDEIQRIKDAEKQKQEAQGKSYDATQGNRRIKEVEGVFKNLIEIQGEQSNETIRKYYNNLLKQYQTYEEKRTALIKKNAEERKRLIEAGAKEENLKIFDKKANKKVAELDNSYKESGSRIALFFQDASEKSLKELRKLVKEGDSLLSQLANKKDFDPNNNPFNLTEEQYDELKTDPEKLKAFTDRLKSLRLNVQQLENPFKQLGETIEEALDPKNADKLPQKLAKIRESFGKVQEVAGFVTDVLNDLAEGTGSEALGNVANAINDTIEVAGKTLKGAEIGAKLGGPVGAIAGAAVGLASGLIKVIGASKDRAKEREVQALQVRVEALKDSYSLLSKEIEKAYSVDAQKKIREQDENLKRQNKLIQRQINAERGKKRSDKGKIKQWEDRIKENNRIIEENKDKAVDAIFGESVQQAINNFASAYTNAWKGGEDMAKNQKNVVKEMIRNMILNLAKSKIKDKVTALRKYLESAFQDGELDENEINKALSMGEEINNIQNSVYGKYEKLLKDTKKEEDPRKAVQKGFASITQDQASGLDSKFTLSTELQRQGLDLAKDLGSSVKILQNNSAKQLRHLAGIEVNTATLHQMKADIGSMKSELQDINDNGIKLK